MSEKAKFEYCIFQGNPPKPFTSWDEALSQDTIQHMTITASGHTHLPEDVEKVIEAAMEYDEAATKEMTSGLVNEYVKEVHERAETAEADAKKKDIIIGSLKMKLEGTDYLLDQTIKENKADEARVKELEEELRRCKGFVCGAQYELGQSKLNANRYRDALERMAELGDIRSDECSLIAKQALKVDTDDSKG